MRVKRKDGRFWPKGNKIINLGNGLSLVILNHGKIALVDTKNVPLLEQFTFYFARSYAVTNIRLPNGKWTLASMHEIIMGRAGMRKIDGLVVDHRSGNGLNNRESNLEVVTNRANVSKGRLSALKSAKTSQYTGVSWFKRDSKWRAHITVNNKFKHLGYFNTEKEASDAYLAALNYVQ